MVQFHNPLEKKDYLSIQHIERYKFAANFLRKGMDVLDIASGNGYGTMIMHSLGCNVIGADYDQKAVEIAKSLWNYKGFIKANALELPFENESFDAIVSFETIEHVKDGYKFLKEMNRVLKVGGTFICSTPNVKYTAHPKFHVKEYKPEEFYKLVLKEFGNIEKYGQYFSAKDRFKDLCNWYFFNKLYSIAFFNKLIVKIMKSYKNNYDVREKNKFLYKDKIYEILKKQSNSFYKVKCFDGEKLLRIMIAVAKKIKT